MNELVIENINNSKLEENLGSTLKLLNANFEDSFANQDRETILTQLQRINLSSIHPNLVHSIKLAISILIIILTSQMVSAQEATVTAPAGLKLRTGPSTKSSLIKILPEGTKVEIIDDLGNWDEVKVDGTDGYVYEKYLDTSAVSGSTEKINPDADYVFTAEDCNNGSTAKESGNHMCYSSLKAGEENIVLGEGFYAHNYTVIGKKILKLRIGDTLQVNKDDGTVLNFKVTNKRYLSATDARDIIQTKSYYYLWTTNPAKENLDPHAKVVFDLVVN